MGASRNGKTTPDSDVSPRDRTAGDSRGLTVGNDSTANRQSADSRPKRRGYRVLSMTKAIAALLLTLLAQGAFPAQPEGAAKTYPLRWVYASRSLRQDSHVEDLRQIVETAAAHGLNGLVLAAGFDRLDLQPPDYFRRLEQVKRICERNRVELIPMMFSAGYGPGILAHNPNLAAGLPVKDALFVVRNGRATLQPDPPLNIVNGGFEEYENGRAKGFSRPKEWGTVIRRDTETVKEGRSSLRFENFGGYPAEAAQLGQVIRVRPHRSYRLSCWVKTEGLDPYGPFGSSRFRLEVIARKDNRRLQLLDPRLPTTADWRKVVVGFNSWGYDEVVVSPRTVGGEHGKLWLDDLRIEEVALVNLLRRPGTPLVVKSETSGTVYQEGRDFEPVRDEKLDFLWDHDPPSIVLTPNSRIRDGERLRVSFYHGISVNRRQVSVCMSEPEVYQIWRKQVELLQKHLAPERYFLSMDEIRAGGSCRACKDRGLTMGQILADCLTRQFEMIRAARPDAEVFVWSDMLDPNHNAGMRTGKYYYMVDGSFYGSWNFIPKELIIACWWYRGRDPCLAHFSRLGFKTFGAAYYDADDLENPKGWLRSLDATPGAVGIMYTTWRNKYKLLGAFGDLVSQRKGQGE